MRTLLALTALTAWPLAAPSLLGGCGSSPATTTAPPDMAFVSTDPLILARPYEYAAPVNIDPKKSYPLVIALHGYRATGYLVEGFFRMTKSVDAKEFVYAYPDGTKDTSGFSHWNSSGDPKDVDDVAYIDAVISDMSSRYKVDPKRILVMGHSNGAAMAYRYGCLRSDKLAAIIPVGGTYTMDKAQCPLTTLISQLQIIGEMDPGYPGNPPVRTQSAFWAMLDGCGAQSDTSAPKIHLNAMDQGPDTALEKWSGCMGGTDVQFWVVGGAPHNVQFDDNFAPMVIDWLTAHPHP